MLQATVVMVTAVTTLEIMLEAVITTPQRDRLYHDSFDSWSERGNSAVPAVISSWHLPTPLPRNRSIFNDYHGSVWVVGWELQARGVAAK